MKKIILLVFLIFGFSVPSYAQQESKKIKTLSQGADVILSGKVTKKNSGWNKDKTRIYSKATVQVDEYLKGKTSQDYIEITYLGGEVGDIGELYTHTPTFSDNEEILVFLKKDKNNNGYQVFNGNEGKIKVFKEAKTKEKTTDANMNFKALKSQIKSYINEK